MIDHHCKIVGNVAGTSDLLHFVKLGFNVLAGSNTQMGLQFESSEIIIVQLVIENWTTKFMLTNLK